MKGNYTDWIIYSPSSTTSSIISSQVKKSEVFPIKNCWSSNLEVIWFDLQVTYVLLELTIENIMLYPIQVLRCGLLKPSIFN